MNIEKAKKVSILVNKKKRYENILKCLSSGYSDEWEIKNTYTGTHVNITNEDWEEIKQIFDAKLKTINKQIDELN